MTVLWYPTVVMLPLVRTVTLSPSSLASLAAETMQRISHSSACIQLTVRPLVNLILMARMELSQWHCKTAMRWLWFSGINRLGAQESFSPKRVWMGRFLLRSGGPKYNQPTNGVLECCRCQKIIPVLWFASLEIEARYKTDLEDTNFSTNKTARGYAMICLFQS